MSDRPFCDIVRKRVQDEMRKKRRLKPVTDSSDNFSSEEDNQSTQRTPVQKPRVIPPRESPFSNILKNRNTTLDKELPRLVLIVYNKMCILLEFVFPAARNYW